MEYFDYQESINLSRKPKAQESLGSSSANKTPDNKVLSGWHKFKDCFKNASAKYQTLNSSENKYVETDFKYEIECQDKRNGSREYTIEAFSTEFVLSNPTEATVTIRQNENGEYELYIANAKDLIIEAKGDNALNIVIENSEINEITTGKGNDKIKIVNSTVDKKIKTGDGSDEIVIINSVINDEINAGKGNNKIKIENSTVNDDILTGDGNDNITLLNTTLYGEIDTEDGNDEIQITGSTVKGNVEGDDGNKTITIKNSEISGNVETDDGNMNILIEDSTIGGFIETETGSDNITLKNVTLKGDLKTDNGSKTINIIGSNVEGEILGRGDINKINLTDSVVTNIYTDDAANSISMRNSTANEIHMGENADHIIIDQNSTVEKLYVDSGDDVVVVRDSKVGEINVKKGDNNLEISGSTIDKIIGGRKNANRIIKTDSSISSIEGENVGVIEDVYKRISVDPKALDEESQDVATEITDNITSKYANRDNLTDEERMQAITIDFLNQNADAVKAQFDNQENEDGFIGDSYNFFKQLLDAGVSKEDIQAAIDEQDQMIKELTASLNGESDESFEECFEKWTGIEYNAEYMQEYYETYNIYQLATTTLNAGAYRDHAVSMLNQEGTTMQDVFNAYSILFEGDEEKVFEEINKVFNEGFSYDCEYYSNNSLDLMAESLTLRKDENGEYWVDLVPSEYHQVSKEYLKEKGMSCISYRLDQFPNISTMGVLFKRNAEEYIPEEKYEDVAKEKIEQMFGVSVEDLQVQFATSQSRAFGNGNAYQRLIDKYCAEQEGFTDKVSQVVSGLGMITMVGGAIVCAFCPPVGATMMSIGHKVSVVGMFLDEGLDLVDEITSGNISDEDLGKIFKDVVIQAALYYSGRGINVVSGGVNTSVFDMTGSKILAKVAEIGVDAPMSLLADYIITGDVSLSGEGFSQLMSIISGIAGGKIQDYNNKVVNEAFTKFDGDIDSQISYMKKNGLSAKAIVGIYSDIDTGDIVVDKKYVKSISKYSYTRTGGKIKMIDLGIDILSEKVNADFTSEQTDNVIALRQSLKSASPDSVNKFIELFGNDIKSLTQGELEYVLNGAKKLGMVETLPDGSINSQSLDKFLTTYSAEGYKKIAWIEENYPELEKSDFSKLLTAYSSREKMIMNTHNIDTWVKNKEVYQEWAKTISHTTGIETTEEKIMNAAGIQSMTGVEMTSRLKGYESIYDKISRKVLNGVKIPDFETATVKIDDLAGTRIVIEDSHIEQAHQIAKNLADAITKGDIVITEIHNYSNGSQKYWTDEDVALIVNASARKGVEVVILAEEQTSKSGYVCAQMNIRTVDKDGNLGLRDELQIKSDSMDISSELEHITYDISRGKDITKNNQELEELFKPVTEAVNKLDREGLKGAYSEYVLDNYRYVREYELGKIEGKFERPKMPAILSEYKILSWESLEIINNQAHAIKVKYGIS